MMPRTLAPVLARWREEELDEELGALVEDVSAVLCAAVFCAAPVVGAVVSWTVEVLSLIHI